MRGDQWPAVDDEAGAVLFLPLCCFLWCCCVVPLLLSLFIELSDFMASELDFMASELDFIALLLSCVGVDDWGGVLCCAITGDMARPKTVAVAKASTA
jgi:hypothetical protein